MINLKWENLLQSQIRQALINQGVKPPIYSIYDGDKINYPCIQLNPIRTSTEIIGDTITGNHEIEVHVLIKSHAIDNKRELHNELLNQIRLMVFDKYFHHNLNTAFGEPIDGFTIYEYTPLTTTHYLEQDIRVSDFAITFNVGGAGYVQRDISDIILPPIEPIEFKVKWGNIEGSIANQTDLSERLSKASKRAITFGFRGKSTGIKQYVVMPYSATIKSYSIVASEPCKVTIDILKKAYNKPTSDNSICNSEYIIMDNESLKQNQSVSMWTNSILKDDVLAFDIKAITGEVEFTVTLDLEGQ